MNRGRVQDWRHGQDPVEVVVLLQNDHDLQNAVNDADSLLQIFRLDNQFFQVSRELLKNVSVLITDPEK